MDNLKASQLLDQTIEASSYSEKLIALIQGIFRTKKINPYEYESLINVATCQMIITDDIKYKLERMIVEEAHKKIRIDVRV